MAFVRMLQKPHVMWCLFKAVETEAMAEADLIPEVEDTMAPETTIIAGKGIVTARGKLFKPIACLT